MLFDHTAAGVADASLRTILIWPREAVATTPSTIYSV